MKNTFRRWLCRHRYRADGYVLRGGVFCPKYRVVKYKCRKCGKEKVFER